MKNGKNISIGLDIGGTSLKAITLELPGFRILEDVERPSGAQESPEAVRKAIGDTVRYFQNKHTINTIGIGCAGSVSPTGLVRNSPNFNNWKNVPLKNWIEKDFKLPVSVDNDANCAVYTEWKMGSAKNYANVLLLTLGTGIGGGLVINNLLLRGATGTAGEIGHFSIHADGIECPCGNRGCFERYCSASALEFLVPNMTTKQVFEQSNTNPRLKKILENFMDNFKTGLTSLANIFDPDIILFGGGISLGFGPYLEEIHQWLIQHAFPAIGPHVKIGLTHFGNQSGALGAALISSDLVGIQ